MSSVTIDRNSQGGWTVRWPSAENPGLSHEKNFTPAIGYRCREEAVSFAKSKREEMTINPSIVESFIEAHRPDRIDVDHIAKHFGSVCAYLEGTCRRESGRRYVEIAAIDSVTGNPVIFDLD
mgnify:CR=1 FL=1